MSLPLSLHAQERMLERGISAAEIRACLRHGQPLKAKAGQTRLHLGTLVVVHDSHSVITVFRRPSLIATLYCAGLRWSLADKLNLALETL